VKGTSTIKDVFRNDYWGRPMTSSSSHKSWRPFTVLTFRYLTGGGLMPRLFCHRMVNIIIHAAVAELVSITSTQIFPWLPPNQTILMRALTKLIFALHPTHVEAVANAANRHVILSVLSSVIMADPSVSMLLVIIMCAVGFLSSETAIFQMPAVLLTMTAIQYNRCSNKEKKEDNGSNGEKKKDQKEEEMPWPPLQHAIVSLLPRYFAIILFSASYLIGRFYFDTLSIPDGLIRPAENPFFLFTGGKRILNYSYVLSVHVCKSFFLDPVGFSHEYGFDCIEEITGLSDIRLLLPQMLAVITLVIVVKCFANGQRTTLLLLMGLSWFATLFPVSGILKVGTFIADRMVVPSTFTVSIFGGRILSAWIMGESINQPASINTRRVFLTVKVVVVMVIFSFFWLKVDQRSSEWMNSFSLIQSSLKTCPRSAKSNLEMGKLYSGTVNAYAHMVDLPKSMSYLEKAEEIDPNYCDVNKEIATVLFQQGDYLNFEERLTNAVMCPFGMQGALDLWQRYWQAVTADPRGGLQARERMQKYEKVIADAIKQAQKEEEEARKKKPSGFVVGTVDEF